MPTTTQENGTGAVPQNGTLDSREVKNDTTSTELEPCLGQSEPKPKKIPFYERYISDLQAKTDLSRKWVLTVIGLVLAVLVLFLVIVGMAIGWPRVPHMFKYPICKESGCLRAAAQIQENLNVSVSPCTNLWEAVCSKWAKNSTRPLDRAVWNQKEQLVRKESERIRDLVATLKLPLNIGTPEWKMKYFYESCLNVDSGSVGAARPLQDIISQLGGWYILHDWSEEDFNGMAILTKLQVEYGVSPFFRIHVEPDPHVPDTHSVRISPSGLGLPDKDYYYRDSDDRILTAYTDFIRDIVIYMEGSRGEATKFGKDIFNYEKRLAEVTPDLIHLQNPITTYNAMSLAELKITNMLPFHDILQAMYTEANISENTEVVLTSPEYLGQIAQIISSTDMRTMNGYLIWTLVRKYIPYLSTKFTSAMDNFNSELYGMSKPLERWEVCARLLKNYMGVLTEYLLEQTYPITDNTRNITNDTFNKVLTVAKDKVNSFDDTTLLAQHLAYKLNFLSLQIGLPESMKSPQSIKNYYVSLKIYKANFFESVKYAINFQKKIEGKMLIHTLPEGVFLTDILSEAPTVRYIPSKNAIVVPRALVMEPYFEDRFPSSIVYGRLGKEIAHAMVSSMLPYGSLWTSDKKILSPFHMTVNESIKSVQASIQCLFTYILDLNLDVPAVKANESALVILTELLAVKMASEALLAVTSSESHIHQGGLEQFENEALYFLSYAQSQCSDSTSQYQTYENIVKFRLSQKTTLHLIWSQLPEFQRAFDCTPNKKIQCVGVF